jgi:anti-sigma-K factor RskA
MQSSHDRQNIQSLHTEQPEPFLVPRNSEPRTLPRRTIHNLLGLSRSVVVVAVVVAVMAVVVAAIMADGGRTLDERMP